jgi:class 3 adenylate cyclase
MSSLDPARSERAEVDLLVAFIDVMGFAQQSTRVADDEIADVIDGYYQLVAAQVSAAGGRAVKFMGDGALVVFAAGDTDRGVEALLAVKQLVDRYLEDRGWPCRVTVKAHVGTAIAGPYGPPDDRRFDVIGKAVNTTAMLDAAGVALSVEAFRKLSPALRQRFKKHTWPVTYIRVEDPHKFRRR